MNHWFYGSLLLAYCGDFLQRDQSPLFGILLLLRFKHTNTVFINQILL
jgi:hypothetical protein